MSETAPSGNGMTGRAAGGTAARRVGGQRTGSPVDAPTTVETRRLRTWEASTEAPQVAWRIILRYQLLRMVRTWWISTMLVVLLVYLVIVLGSGSYQLADGRGPDADTLTGFATMLILPAVVLAFAVGTPQFADDLRFNAPLFYFSRPVERKHYFLGKAGFVALSMGAVSIAPALLLSVLLLVLVPLMADAPATYTMDEQAVWRMTHADTFVDAFISVVVLLPALVTIVAFAGALALVLSAYTRRAWHAAVGIVAIFGSWSALAGAASGLMKNSVYADLTGPGGWFNLILYVPLAARFQLPALRGESSAYAARELAYYEGWAGATLLAYVLLWATTLLALSMAWRRIQNAEADA